MILLWISPNQNSDKYFETKFDKSLNPREDFMVVITKFMVVKIFWDLDWSQVCIYKKKGCINP